MINELLDLIQTVVIVILAWDLNRQRKTLRVVARMAAGADNETEPTPDAEKARKSAEAIDKFNVGIANILNYTGEAEK